MEKMKINNQIVSMRKFVKQAKVRTINKLVKDVKNLQVKKGNDNQLEKHKRKVERLLLEIEIIKKIQPDSVSKLVLTNEKDWKNILSNKNATLDERSFALVADYEPLQKEAKNFLGNNPNLLLKIPNLIKEWEVRKNETPNPTAKKMKASEIRSNRKQRFSRGKSVHPSRTANLSANRRGKSISQEQNIAEHRVPLLSSNTSGIDKLTVSSSEKEIEKNATECAKQYDAEVSINIVNETNLDLKCDVNTLKPRDNLKAIKTLKLSELQEEDEIPIDVMLPDLSDSNDLENRKHKSDPFFLGENEISCDKNDVINEELITKDDIMLEDSRNNVNPYHKLPRSNRSVRGRGNFHSNKSYDSKERKNFQGRTSTKHSGFGQGSNFEPFGRGVPRYGTSRGTQKKFHERHSSNVKNQRGEIKEKLALHPSWEAKKRLKELHHNTASKPKRVVFENL